MKGKVLIYFFLLLHTHLFCFREEFVNLQDWIVERGSSSLVYKIESDPLARDNSCLVLEMPKGYNLVGPTKGINVISRERYRYGRYCVRMKSGSGLSGDGIVSAFFTYFNDYWQRPNNFTDTNNNGISDNSEIDIELLSQEKQVIYMSIWTDYDEVGGQPRFRKVTRKVNLVTGEIYQTPLGKEHTYELEKISDVLSFRISDFDHSLRYYEYGFWWSSSSVRFFICIDGEEKELWNFERSDLIPTNYSNIIVNLWHNDVHWDNGTKANPPSVDCVLKIDWIEYKDFKEPIELKKEYILNLREPDKSIINFGKVREVKICDINGRLIKTLFQHSEYLAETSCEEKIWDGKDLRGRIVKSGVYIYQIENNGEIFTGKILVIK